MCNNCNEETPITTRQIKSVDVSLGKDGESAYETYVRLGGKLSEADWSALSIKSIPTPSNESFIIV